MTEPNAHSSYRKIYTHSQDTAFEPHMNTGQAVASYFLIVTSIYCHYKIYLWNLKAPCPFWNQYIEAFIGQMSGF